MKPITIIAAIAAALVVLLLAIGIYLPTYLETRLLPRWSAKAGIDLQTVHIRRIGWNGADLGPIRLAASPDIVVEIAAVQIDYSPTGLIRKEVEAVVISGVRIELTIGDGGALPDRVPEEGRARTAPAGGIPVGLERLSIHGGLLAVTWKESAFTVPFEVDLDTTRLRQGSITGTVRFAPGGKRPIAAAISNDGWDAWRWSLTPFQVSGPLLVRVTELGGELTFGDHGWQAAVSALTKVPIQVLETHAAAPLTLAYPLDTQWHVAVQSGKEGVIHFDLGATGEGLSADNRLVVQHEEMAADGRAPDMTVTGTFDGQSLSARIRGSVADVGVRMPVGTAHFPMMTLTGEIKGPEELRIDAVVDLSAARLELDSTVVQLPDCRVDARLRQNEASGLRLDGEWRVNDGRISDEVRAVRMLGLQIRLPLQWPVPARGPAGLLRAGPIWWRTENLGDIDGRVGLLPHGLWAEATHRSKLFPGLNVLMDAQVLGTQTVMSLTVPPFSPPDAVDLSRFAPAAAGFTLNGRFEAEADIRTGGSTQQATARLRIAEGAIHHPSSGLALAGIGGDLHLKGLLPVSSAPEQRLRVEKLTLGTLNAEQLTIDFQIEPDMTLFIERAGLRWARGELHTQAFRLKPGLEDVAVTVYGDRLNLAEVLEQLGAAKGTGEGAVNGRIPVRWRHGRLSFDNGFLYSTPGQSGTILLHGTDFLMQGLPPGSPQHTQLDIATEALKDYTYNWARLTLVTRNDDLILGLQLDGKPNRLLPFAYDPQSGSFQRFKGEGQAEFKGIRIDLNFTIPLDALLDYKTLLTPKSQ